MSNGEEDAVARVGHFHQDYVSVKNISTEQQQWNRIEAAHLFQGAVMKPHTSFVTYTVDCIQKKYERKSLSLCPTNVILPRQFTVTNWQTQLISVEGRLIFIWEWCFSIVYWNNCHGVSLDLLPYVDADLKPFLR
jgi:hypothetical protein